MITIENIGEALFIGAALVVIGVAIGAGLMLAAIEYVKNKKSY